MLQVESKSLNLSDVNMSGYFLNTAMQGCQEYKDRPPPYCDNCNRMLLQPDPIPLFGGVGGAPSRAHSRSIPCALRVHDRGTPHALIARGATCARLLLLQEGGSLMVSTPKAKYCLKDAEDSITIGEMNALSQLISVIVFMLFLVRLRWLSQKAARDEDRSIVPRQSHAPRTGGGQRRTQRTGATRAHRPGGHRAHTARTALRSDSPTRRWSRLRRSRPRTTRF